MQKPRKITKQDQNTIWKRKASLLLKRCYPEHPFTYDGLFINTVNTPRWRETIIRHVIEYTFFIVFVATRASENHMWKFVPETKEVVFRQVRISKVEMR